MYLRGKAEIIKDTQQAPSQLRKTYFFIKSGIPKKSTEKSDNSFETLTPNSFQ